MVKTLAKSIREYKKPSILSPIFVSIEVILECLMPLVIMQFIAKINPSGTTSTEGVQMSMILIYGVILIAMAVLSLVTGMLSGRFAARASATSTARTVSRTARSSIRRCGRTRLSA